jgi:hypothetical protein
MSSKHYNQPTAAERAYLKYLADKEKKMTPAEKKKNRTRSTPAKLKTAKQKRAETAFKKLKIN